MAKNAKGLEAVESLGLRVMQISFKRDAAEHADNLFFAGRLMLNMRMQRRPVVFLLTTLLLGAAIGVSFEYYRRFVLGPFFGVQNLPSIDILFLEILPLVIVCAVAVAIEKLLSRKKKKAALASSLHREVFLDIDVHEKGMVISRDSESTSYDWSAFKKVEIRKEQIAFYQDDRIVFIPARAFKEAAAFKSGAKEILSFWQAARRAKLASANQNQTR